MVEIRVPRKMCAAKRHDAGSEWKNYIKSKFMICAPYQRYFG
jgi:hypothetical protein